MTLPPHLDAEFRRWEHTADEWLIAYAQLSATFIVVYPVTFAMAMTIELYIKAYSLKSDEKEVDATEIGHDMTKEYSRLQSMHPPFPPRLQLRPSLCSNPLYELDREDWKCDWFQSLSIEEQEDIRTNYEVYLAMAYSVDLKYGITPPRNRKHRERIISSTWKPHNPWLAAFVREMKSRLGSFERLADDRLQQSISLCGSKLHPDAVRYLAGIIETNGSRLQTLGTHSGDCHAD